MNSYVNIDLWLELLNSDWHDYRGSGRREDRIDDSTWLARYTAPWRGVLRGAPPSEVRAALKSLRMTIRGIVDHLAAGAVVPRLLLRELNSVMAASPVIWRIEKTLGGYELSAAPLTAELRTMTAEIASSFAETLAQGEPSRIKVCENQACLWVFYDKSKNRSRRWCEGNTGCGNLMKVRRFRARKRTL